MFFSRVGLRVAELKFQPWLLNLVPMFNKNEEKGYFSQSCIVRSAVIV